MVSKTFSIEAEKLELLRKLSKETGIPQSLLIRRAVDNLLRDNEEQIKGHTKKLVAFATARHRHKEIGEVPKERSREKE